MVEGPGCKVKGEALRKRILHEYVNNVDGQVIKKHQKKEKKTEKDVARSSFHDMIGKKISSIETLGKELFVFFDGQDFCLRLHFLMDGGFRLNGKKIDHEMGGEAAMPTLLISLSSSGFLAFNNCAADIRSEAECLKKIADFRHLDICFEGFSHKMALEKFLQQGQRLVCDVLLDQEILPGVGNIIKNEGLFDSGIMPDCKVAILTESHVSHLIKMTRDFSLIFYKCRRDNKPLWPYMKIYNKEQCKQCGRRIIKTKMGEDSGRLTWFCSSCQSSDPSKIKTKLPTKNSLLGWVTTRGKQIGSNEVLQCPTKEESEKTWACTQCTLINKESRTSCEVCLYQRTMPAVSDDKKTSYSTNANEHKISNVWNSSVAKNRTQSESEEKVPDLPSFETAQISATGTKRKSDSSLQAPLPKSRRFSFEHCLPVTSESSVAGHTSIDSKHSRVLSTVPKKALSSFDGGMVIKARHFSNSESSSQSNSQATHTAPRFAAPFCPQHNVKCKMRQVHKEGNNRHRMFWSCPARGRCNFFHWADENFPICEGHGKRTVLRTVLKQGSNNGRKFFACALNKKKQCGFFQWAEGIE